MCTSVSRYHDILDRHVNVHELQTWLGNQGSLASRYASSDRVSGAVEMSIDLKGSGIYPNVESSSEIFASLLEHFRPCYFMISHEDQYA